MGKKLTKAEWVMKAKQVHGDVYDYSKVNYINANTKVKIICKRHGEFWQKPSSHVNAGKGCAKCKGGVKIDTTEFRIRAAKTHGDAYDYSGVDYTNAHTKVEIKCNKCGLVFMQIPGHHLHGVGCPKCGNAQEDKKISFAEVKQKILDKFGGVYDFTDSVYKGRLEPLTVKCKLCGREVISSRANKLYNGHKTTSCRCVANYIGGGFKDYLPGILYYIRVQDDSGIVSYKIGITNKSVEERMDSRDLHKVTTIKTWNFPDGRNARTEEKRILEDFNVYKTPKGYAPLRSGNTELFTKDVLELDVEKHNEYVKK